MEEAVLVMIVSPLMGHTAPALEMAKLMVDRSTQISITVLVMKLPTDPENSARIDSLIAASSTERLHFLRLPVPEDSSQWCSTNKGTFLDQLIEYEKSYVRETVSKIKNLSGLIVDLATTSMMDVADEFEVPSYIYFSSGAAFLGLLLHFQTLEDEQNLKVSDQLQNYTELITPCFIKPVPVGVLPTVTTNREAWCGRFLWHSRRYRKAKAIIINTFAELEHHALNSFSSDSAYGKSRLPPIHTVGPILNRFQTSSSAKNSEIMQWLDAQSPSSVVLVCFGSMGSLDIVQIKEIANGIERSGYRFLWSLRQAPVTKGGFPTEYQNYETVMPEGFLNRTKSLGKVVGWIPQLAVLSHSAVGGFVSHCGWNSTLESIWCGVPIATLPIFAEQQLNAFQLVKDLGIAVEISLDYNENKENKKIITAEQMEKGIRKLMDGENEVSKRVKEFSEKSRLAMCEGGSSYFSLQNFIETIGSKAF